MLTIRQFWLLLHLGVGALFIHGFLAGRALFLDGAKNRRRARVGVVTMATAAWVTVISGTWTVYGWYRAVPPVGAPTVGYPKAFLIDDHDLAIWHEFAMEWKEHVGWLAPILATAVAVLAIRHRDVLLADAKLRRFGAGLVSVAFATALLAAALGAGINKVAPNQFLGL